MKPHYMDDDIIIHKVKCGPYDNNAYLLVCPETNESIIIDTPSDPSVLLAVASVTSVRSIVITHNHIDHLLGFDEVIDTFDVPVSIGMADADALPKPADLLLQTGSQIKAGKITLEAIHTPGHTDGSICYLFQKHLFTGDTLFPGGPGKTKSPENLTQIIDSLTTKIFTLSSGILIYPGHGDDGVLEDSKKDYAIFASKEHDANLCGDVEWVKH